MPSPLRDPKSLAEWIELDYFRRPRELRRWKLWVVLLALVLCVAGLCVLMFQPRSGVFYQAGPLSGAHALFNDDCAACHTQQFQTARRFWPTNAKLSTVADATCEHCHDGPLHQEQQTFTPGCSSCHREHRGRVSLSVMPDGHCTECHADLKRKDGQPSSVPNVTAFAADHPEFALWRQEKPKDPGTIRFNHQLHLKPDLAGPEGKPVTLDCLACHQPDSSRRYMQPVQFDRNCKDCHALTPQVVVGEQAGEKLREAVRRFAREPAPHREPPLVYAVMLDRYLQFARDYPEAQEALPQPPWSRTIPGRPVAGPRDEMSKDWVGRQMQYFRTLVLDGPGGCRYCHQVTGVSGSQNLPVVAPAHLLTRWFAHARFNHDEHRLLDCGQCHDARDSSQNTDVLMPKVALCQECHAPAAGVRSDCVECHDYHDRTKRQWHGTMTISECLRK